MEDCGSLDIGLTSDGSEILGSVAIVTKKEITTSDSVTYAL